jgi:ElaB/YqjD/DUF883 family membrane-anchored ribosome-binding protein
MADFSSNPVSQAGHATESIGQSVKDMGSKMRERSGDIMEGARDTAKDLGHRAQEGFDFVKERASDYASRGKEQLESASHAVQDQVQQRPMSAILIAAGVGFVLGLLWMRK